MLFSHRDDSLYEALLDRAATEWRRTRRRRAVPAPRRATAPRPPRPAAGILCRHTDHHGDWYLLGLRAPRLGGTWSNIGGSLDGDDPLAGALREFHEELAIPAHRLVGARITATIDCGTPTVPYTLFVLDVPTPFYDAVLSWEHTDLAWWHHDDVDTLNLHAGFRRAWTALHPEGVLL